MTSSRGCFYMKKLIEKFFPQKEVKDHRREENISVLERLQHDARHGEFTIAVSSIFDPAVYKCERPGAPITRESGSGRMTFGGVWHSQFHQTYLIRSEIVCLETDSPDASIGELTVAWGVPGGDLEKIRENLYASSGAYISARLFDRNRLLKSKLVRDFNESAACGDRFYHVNFQLDDKDMEIWSKPHLPWDKPIEVDGEDIWTRHDLPLDKHVRVTFPISSLSFRHLRTLPNAPRWSVPCWRLG